MLLAKIISKEKKERGERIERTWLPTTVFSLIVVSFFLFVCATDNRRPLAWPWPGRLYFMIIPLETKRRKNDILIRHTGTHTQERAF